MKRTTFLLAALLPLAVLAQTEGQYVIQGIYNPTLIDAQKIDLRPEGIDTILPNLPVNYALLPAKADIAPRVDSLAAARLSVEKAQARLYKGYLKGGFGLYATPLGELYYDQGRSRKNGYGIHLKHMSSNGGLDDVGPSRYSHNSIDGYYRHIIADNEASGRLTYDRRRISYYGYPSNDSIESVIQNAPDPPKDRLRQYYNDIGFAGRVRSLYEDSSRISHDVGLDVHTYSNLSGSRETNVRVLAEAGKQEHSEYYHAGLLIDNNTYRADLGQLGEFRQNGTLLGLTPSVRTVGRRYFVKAGVGMYLDAMGSTTFHFFPQAYAHYALFDNILVPYVGVEGERRRNSFRSLTRENPWLGPAPGLANTSKLFDAYGGLRGSFMNNLGFDVRASFSGHDNYVLFINVPNPPYGDRMAVVYDEVEILDLSGELTYSRISDLRLSARIDVYTYTVRVQEEPWNLPPYRLAFAARYSLRDKLILKGEALFLGRRPAFRAAEPGTDPGVLLTSTRTELDGFLDLYIGAEYRYTKRLSLFLDASNLTASKYERWYRHPVQRGLLMVGATYAF
ncbi:MAG: hypothetical protein QY325_09625 [Flavobacteriales bacterium]|nr:MAG: hypothetical protein QY325_09625 [Flavobacteriales bacterium]